MAPTECRVARPERQWGCSSDMIRRRGSIMCKVSLTNEASVIYIVLEGLTEIVDDFLPVWRILAGIG